MGIVEFDKDNLSVAYETQMEKRGVFVEWLIKSGIAKNKSVANVILISLVIISFTVAFFLFRQSGIFGKTVKKSAESSKLIQILNEKRNR